MAFEPGIRWQDWRWMFNGDMIMQSGSRTEGEICGWISYPLGRPSIGSTVLSILAVNF